ncbi:MAG: OmpH/Skp family outer membrane protein [Planctomycetota bacterium]|jgi:Skp family chaperone for outer membrane proteins
MKVKTMVLCCLTGLFVFCLGQHRDLALAENKDVGGCKMGIVSVRKVFENCKRNEKYREQALEERKNLEAELQKLEAEIEAAKAGLKTLKPNSSEYMEQVKEILIKQGSLDAQQKFYKRELELKDQRWTENLYQDILDGTKKVAEQEGLNLVFETGEPEIPSLGAQELMLTIRTHKLLYSGGCMDVTDKVMALLDAEK